MRRYIVVYQNKQDPEAYKKIQVLADSKYEAFCKVAFSKFLNTDQDHTFLQGYYLKDGRFIYSENNPEWFDD